MIEVRFSANPAAGSDVLAARLADVSARILACIECDQLEEALTLTDERGRLIAELLNAGAQGPGIEGLLSDARLAGQSALVCASRRATELNEELSSLNTGRSGLSAYDPGAVARGSLDVSR